MPEEETHPTVLLQLAQGKHIVVAAAHRPRLAGVEPTVPIVSVVLDEIGLISNMVFSVRPLHQHTLGVVDAQEGEVEGGECSRAAVRLVHKAELQMIEVVLFLTSLEWNPTSVA